MAKYPGVSPSVTRRLPRYYRFLGELMNSGAERISSREFAEIIGLTASQIRQDLNCFGGFGQQGYGYNVAMLYQEIGRILGVDRMHPAILIGAGNLGLAIANHMAFEQRGFKLVGIFDNNPKVVGQEIRGLTVRSISELVAVCEEYRPKAAFLCIPRGAAMELADTLVDMGVKGFWNFSHYDLSIAYGEKIAVENVHLGDSLMTLSYQVNQFIDE
ncbi:redox-sensing transcriptional repressor Rex (plasmid) [Oscillospiraceae bacterium MB08-C2-2]|nr:redox-sensing transcriptional repressor Rex [Oscillospiraceae bacterium MB08-C2-2]